MKVTISGLPGSGTTTASERLASRFGWPHINAGEEFRRHASVCGMTVDELNTYAEGNEEFDKQFGEHLQKKAAVHDNLIFESRYTGRQLDDMELRVWLGAPREVRVERIASREAIGVTEARRRVDAREESIRKRVDDFYDNIELDDRDVYDIELNTSRWSADAVVDVLSTAIDRVKADKPTDKWCKRVQAMKYAENASNGEVESIHGLPI